ncbi:hypothetical protein BC830DRAFT_1081997 [Chytriomyces sp. MP71]|nr:hypothetical protein BC830DRAFT_1081997 [Chytriomyces sp. MP71]
MDETRNGTASPAAGCQTLSHSQPPPQPPSALPTAPVLASSVQFVRQKSAPVAVVRLSLPQLLALRSADLPRKLAPSFHFNNHRVPGSPVYNNNNYNNSSCSNATAQRLAAQPYPTLGASSPLQQQPAPSATPNRKLNSRPSIPPTCLISLEEAFKRSPKPTRSEKKAFSDRLGISYQTIQLWFQGKRAQLRRDVRKSSNTAKIPVPNSSTASQDSLSQHEPDDECDSDMSVDADTVRSTPTSLISISETPFPMDLLQPEGRLSSGPSEISVSIKVESPPALSSFINSPPPQNVTESKRPRIKPRKDQTEFLISKFAVNPKPDKDERAIIANQLALPLNFVTLWFQNRRSKVQREGSCDLQQASALETQDSGISVAEQDILDAASLLFCVANGVADTKSSKERETSPPKPM